MKTVMKCCALIMLAATAVVWAQESIRLSSSVQKVETFVNEQGEEERRLLPAERVVVGDELRYTITFTNQGDETVEGGTIVVTNPIPDTTTYLENSAGGPGTDVEFSADGGESWGSPGELTVTNEDGRLRAAAPAEYTHIRWTYRPALEPGQESSLFFRVRLH